MFIVCCARASPFEGTRVTLSDSNVHVTRYFTLTNPLINTFTSAQLKYRYRRWPRIIASIMQNFINGGVLCI